VAERLGENRVVLASGGAERFEFELAEEGSACVTDVTIRGGMESRTEHYSDFKEFRGGRYPGNIIIEVFESDMSPRRVFRYLSLEYADVSPDDDRFAMPPPEPPRTARATLAEPE
jgi:hypothetical protein